MIRRTESADRQTVGSGAVKNEECDTLSFEQLSEELLGFRRDFILTIADDMPLVESINCLESFWTNSGIIVARKVAPGFIRRHVAIVGREQAWRQGNLSSG